MVSKRANVVGENFWQVRVDCRSASHRVLWDGCTFAMKKQVKKTPKTSERAEGSEVVKWPYNYERDNCFPCSLFSPSFVLILILLLLGGCCMCFNKTNVAWDDVPHTECSVKSLSTAAAASLEDSADVQRQRQQS